MSFRVLALAALAVLLGGNAVSWTRLPAGAQPPLRLVSAPQDVVQDASLAVCGMRRLAADLAFVQALLYYGAHESDGQEESEREGAGQEPAHHDHSHERDYAAGDYPELLARGRRILSLDAHFSYAVLYVAGALAFNQSRPQEAVTLLEEAREREPKNWRYSAYIAASAFHAQGDMERTLRALDPVLWDTDCPTMLKNMAAYINIRLGRREQAARLYREILGSRDQGYHDLAQRALRRLGIGS